MRPICATIVYAIVRAFTLGGPLPGRAAEAVHRMFGVDLNERR